MKESIYPKYHARVLELLKKYPTILDGFGFIEQEEERLMIDELIQVWCDFVIELIDIAKPGSQISREGLVTVYEQSRIDLIAIDDMTFSTVEHLFFKNVDMVNNAVKASHLSRPACC